MEQLTSSDHSMLSHEVSPTLERLCCPVCRSELAHCPTGAACTVCGRPADRLAPNLLNFLGGDQAIAHAIVNWPPEFIQRLATWIEDGGTSETVALDFRAQLAHHGLIGPDGGLTPLGADVRYHVSEFHLQTGRKALDGILELSAIGPRLSVLDVGCGAGQTLRLLEPHRYVELAGVDINLRALALGRQFARLEGIPILLAAATAYALPFRAESFDLVLTRVALNYMHQRSALTEMVRTLRPGGFLVCGVEGIWHDLSLIVHSPSARALVCRGRDFTYGLIHSLAGWQPMPGSTLRGGRTFATAARLVRILESLNCRICRVAESAHGSRFVGRATQLVVIAQRQPRQG